MSKTTAKSKPKSSKKPPTTPKKNGRPTKYSDKLADRICQKIAEGYSVRSICKEKDMVSMQTLFRWLRENDKFREQYVRACKERSYAQAEEIIDIADNATNDYMEKLEGDGYIFNSENVQRSRLRIDTRKWLMAKMNPKVYGDKLDMTTNGNDIGVALSAKQAEQLLKARADRRDS